MRYVPRALLAGILGFGVALLAGCGSSGGLLSADQASTLNAQLNQVSAALASRNCAAVASAVQTLTNSASSLGGVDGKLSDTVAQGADDVATLAQRQCPQTTSSTSSSSSTTSTSTSTSSTTPTTTTTTTTTTTPTTTSTTSTSTSTSTTATAPATTATTGGTGGAGLGGGTTTDTSGATASGGAAGLPGGGTGG